MESRENVSSGLGFGVLMEMSYFVERGNCGTKI